MQGVLSEISQPRKSVDSDFYDKELYAANQPKMAVLISDDFCDMSVEEGSQVIMEFTVKNESELAWPFKPLVMNEREPEIKQQVNARLKPGETTVVKYVMRAPLYSQSKKLSVLLQLVNPNDYEKFCDATVAVRLFILEPRFEEDTMIFERIGDPERHSLQPVGSKFMGRESSSTNEYA